MAIIKAIQDFFHRRKRWKLADRRGWACLGHAFQAQNEKEIKRWVTKSNRYYSLTV
jgi:hypothetical protein